jgi:aldose 1-epimerase
MLDFSSGGIARTRLAHTVLLGSLGAQASLSAELPSGRQFEIRRGRQHAVVVEVGATLREYSIDGVSAIEGFQAHEMADGGRGQPLLPWPNRLADGQYTFDGRELHLPIDEISRHNASHGLTRWLNWSPVQQTESSIALGYVLHPRPGYPFTLGLRLEYTLHDAGLAVRTTAENLGQRALPFGAGFHPYLTVNTPTVDDVVLQLPAQRFLLVDERMLPTGEQRDISGTELDFRVARPIGPAAIDTCFTELERDADGMARVVLRNNRAELTMWMDNNFGYVQVFSGDTLAPDRRRRGLAVEPMTCAPNAFRTGAGVVRLEPGQKHTSTWGLEPSALTKG